MSNNRKHTSGLSRCGLGILWATMLFLVLSVPVYASQRSDSASILQREKALSDLPIGMRYTENNPLVVVSDWNYPPLSYIDLQGNPAGYYVDLLKEIFSVLHIPHKIKLTDWRTAKEDISSGRAHVMLDIHKRYFSYKGASTENSFGTFHVALAYRPDSRGVHRFSDLTETDTVYYNGRDYVDDYFKSLNYNLPCEFKLMTYDRAMDSLVAGKIKYYIAGEFVLRNIVHMQGVKDSVTISRLEDVPPGQLHLYSNDKKLLNMLDRIQERLEKSGKLQQIYDAWFADDVYERDVQQSEDESRQLINLCIAVAVLCIIFAICVLFIMRHYGSDAQLLQEFNDFIDIARGMSDTSVVVIDVKNLHLNNVYGHFLPAEGISFREFESLIHHDDLPIEEDARMRVDAGEEHVMAINIRIRRPGTGEDYRTMCVTSCSKRDLRNQPTHIFLSLRDDTELLKEKQKLDILVRDYDQVYGKSKLAIAFYTLDGGFISANESMKDAVRKYANVFGMEYFAHTRLFDIPFVHNDADISDPESFYACSFVEIPEIGVARHFSYRLRVIRDANGIAQCYALVLADAENEYQYHKEKVRLQKLIASAEGTYDNYFTELVYIMERNRMWPFIHDHATDYFMFAPNRRDYDLKVPLRDYMDSILDAEGHNVLDVLANIGSYISMPYHVVHHFNRFIGHEDEDCWFSINTMPIFNNEGTLVASFGIVYDVTEQKLMEQNLRDETEKANDASRQKSIFLANMTHEIRTPLNAINGFAEILRYTADAAEQTEYVNIMRQNCNLLISLIDNILQLSMIDADGLVLNKQEVEFEHAFRDNCDNILSKFTIADDVTVSIETPMKPLILNLDMPRTMQITEAFISNAAKYCEHGNITIGYTYADGALSIFCKDSGCGIPEDKQKAIFEPFVQLNDFVQGTGLGLSVCRVIAEKMGGNITLQSEVGKGSTFTLTLFDATA